MENDIKTNKKKENEDSFNNQNDINNINYLNTIEKKYNYENKENNSEHLSIFDKYKLQNIENLNHEIKESNKISNKDKIENDKELLIEQEMIRKNENYTNQINEIISKNFKHGIEMSQNLIFNSYLNNNSNNKYSELDRERKLLLLKNIELEKEINNLNNFVDIGSKFNQNRILNHNKLKKKNKESKNEIRRYIKEERNYKKEINEAQNMIKMLDKRINKLKEEINMNYSMSKNKYKEKIKEIKIWRETFYEEFYKYKNLLKDLKENLNKDKIVYNDVLLKMKQKATDNVNTIYDNYKTQILDNDKKLNFLRNENEKLINKENKVKEIFLYNFK